MLCINKTRKENFFNKYINVGTDSWFKYLLKI